MLATIFWLICMMICAGMANDKGRSPYLWFAIAFFLGPIAVIIIYNLDSK